MFEFVRCSKNDVYVRLMFDKMVFDSSLIRGFRFRFFYIFIAVWSLNRFDLDMLIFFHQNWQYFSKWEHGVTMIKNARKTFVFLRPEVPADYSDMCISLLKMCHPTWLSLTIDRKIDLNLKYPFKTFTPKLDLLFEKTVLNYYLWKDVEILCLDT